ncbi:hypothetical protein GCM10025783_00210 [Amnibacterium soli]|uniref:DUF4349 domain-containing protein n=1 Tax=Amnibacterium soli TaxID=1282736 RepID=A0ABP8YR47_9MICO
MRTRILPAAAAALLVVGALAGCTASSGGSAASSGGSVGGFVSGEGVAGPAAAKGATADRSVVTTGSLQLVARHPITVAGRITDLVERAGGRVATSSEDPTGTPSARLALRIPAAAFPRVLDAIEREGDAVRDVSIGSSDVTAEVTDYGVRTANLRTSIARLQTLLSKATSSSALVEIEGALTDRQGKLEQLLAEQRTLADQVASATLTVSIVVPAAAPRSGPTDFLGGLVTGADGLVRTAAALAVGVGIVLPWLLVLGAIGGVAGLVVRRVRRARPTSA